MGLGAASKTSKYLAVFLGGRTQKEILGRRSLCLQSTDQRPLHCNVSVLGVKDTECGFLDRRTGQPAPSSVSRSRSSVPHGSSPPARQPGLMCLVFSNEETASEKAEGPWLGRRAPLDPDVDPSCQRQRHIQVGQLRAGLTSTWA